MNLPRGKLVHILLKMYLNQYLVNQTNNLQKLEAKWDRFYAGTVLPIRVIVIVRKRQMNPCEEFIQPVCNVWSAQKLGGSLAEIKLARL